ncbi:MAG: lysophospholipid transporter LplT [Sulfuricella sp.]|nr:lysophospholipid transporter LplT [Sulfuricella sp.]
MNDADNKNDGLFSRGMIAVLIAQFLSALADNALLFAAIAMLKAHAAPSWQTPMLQEAFVVAFIFLAPFVGPFADAWPKGRVMLVANAMKFVGAAAMLLGLHPLIAYNLVGLGAAAYSPAKYGILSELVGADKLVKANGMMEGSTIVAILLGAVLGGMLADASASMALTAICVCYLLAAGANALIPRLPAAHRLERFSPLALVRDFWVALGMLVRNRDARFSLLGTSVFWGSGSTLRLLLVAWVPVALGIADLSMPANMSGAVAIGIAFGAAGAASLVRLDTVNRALPAGILIGLVIIAFAHVTHLYMAIALLVLVGACGGFYVVPLNALLQEKGHETVGAGHAVAVQNFFENFAMLGLVGLYTLMDRSGFPVVESATMFGGVVLIAIGLLAVYRIRSKSLGETQNAY